MKCFNHRETEAVGVCRNCNKTVCPECVLASDFPIGVVCSEPCRERIERLLGKMDSSERLNEQAEMRYAHNMAQNERDREKINALYGNLASQEKRAFMLCAAVAFAMFGYCFGYAKFLDWYFSLGMGIFLLIAAFNAQLRSEAYKKYAAEV